MAHQCVIRKSRRPDGCWSWVVCASSFCNMLITMGFGSSFGLLLPPIMDAFQETRAKTAWVGSLALAICFLFTPLAAAMCDRLGYRITAIIGSILSGTGLLISSFVTSFPLLYLTYSLILGLGLGLTFNASVLVVLKYFIKWRAVAVGITFSSVCLGTLTITQVTSTLLKKYSLQRTLQAMSILACVPLIASCVFDPITVASDQSDCLRTETSENKYHTKLRWLGFDLFRIRSFVVFTISVIVMSLGYYVPSVHMVKYAEKELSVPQDRTAQLYIYYSITSFFSRHLVCKLSDIKWIRTVWIYQISIAAAGINFMLIPLARSYQHLLGIFVVYGVFDGGSMVLFPLILLESVGQHRINRAWGIFGALQQIAAAIGTPLAGLVADQVGTYVPAFYACGALCIAGALLVAFMGTSDKVTATEHVDERIQITDETAVLEKETVL